MAEGVLMPKAGITVESCVIGEWKKNVGDQVAVGDILFTYETDKAEFECESTAAGTLLAQFYAEQELSSLLILPEVKDSDIASIAPARNGKPVPTGVMIYGHMPLMLTRACPLQNIHDCAHCDKTGVLTDRKAKKFPVRCGLGVRTIYNPVPIYMGDKPGALAVDYGVAYFTLESREEAAQILDSIRTHAPFEGEFTRGLYFKGTN
jgi:putative protease